MGEQSEQVLPGAAPHLDLWSVLYVEYWYWVHRMGIYSRWSQGRGDNCFGLCEDTLSSVGIEVGFVSECYRQMCRWNWKC